MSPNLNFELILKICSGSFPGQERNDEDLEELCVDFWDAMLYNVIHIKLHLLHWFSFPSVTVV